MEVAPVVGLLGDLTTLSGGIVLAWDAVTKEREFSHVRSVNAMRESKPMGGITFDENGVILTDKDDVARAVIRQTAHQAVWGCGILVGGFGLLLASRVLEMLK
jgi:hypothetical protein